MQWVCKHQVTSYSCPPLSRTSSSLLQLWPHLLLKCILPDHSTRSCSQKKIKNGHGHPIAALRTEGLREKRQGNQTTRTPTRIVDADSRRAIRFARFGPKHTTQRPLQGTPTRAHNFHPFSSFLINRQSLPFPTSSSSSTTTTTCRLLTFHLLLCLLLLLLLFRLHTNLHLMLFTLDAKPQDYSSLIVFQSFFSNVSRRIRRRRRRRKIVCESFFFFFFEGRGRRKTETRRCDASKRSQLCCVSERIFPPARVRQCSMRGTPAKESQFSSPNTMGNASQFSSPSTVGNRSEFPQ